MPNKCFIEASVKKEICAALNKNKSLEDTRQAIQVLRSSYDAKDYDKMCQVFQGLLKNGFIARSIHPSYVENPSTFEWTLKNNIPQDNDSQDYVPTGTAGEIKQEIGKMQDDFLVSYFSLNSSAKQSYIQYVKEQINSRLFKQTNSNGLPMFVTTNEDLNSQILNYQRHLVSRIKEYLKDYAPNLYSQVKDFDLYRGTQNINQFFNVLEPYFTDPSNFKNSLAFINKQHGLPTQREPAQALSAWITLRHFDELMLNQFNGVIHVAKGMENLWVNDNKKYSINFASNNVTTWDDGTKDFDPIDELGNLNKLFIETMHEYDQNGVATSNLMKIRDIYLARNKQWEIIGTVKGQSLIFNPKQSLGINPETQMGVYLEDVIHDEFDSLFGVTKVNELINKYANKSLSQMLATMTRNSRYDFPFVYFIMLQNSGEIAHNVQELKVLRSIYINMFDPKNKDSLLRCSLNTNPFTTKRDYYTSICQMLTSANPNNLLEYVEDVESGISGRNLSQNTREQRRNELQRFIQAINFGEQYPENTSVNLELKPYTLINKQGTQVYSNNRWLTITYKANNGTEYKIEKITEPLVSYKVTRIVGGEEKVVYSTFNNLNIRDLTQQDFTNLCGLFDQIMPLDFNNAFSAMSAAYFGNDDFQSKFIKLIKFTVGILHAKEISIKLKDTSLENYNSEIKRWYGPNAPGRMRNLKAVEILAKPDFPILLELSEARDITDGVFGDNVVRDGANKQIAASGNQQLSTSVQTQFEAIKGNPEYAAHNFSLYSHYKGISWMRDYKGADGTVKSATDFNSSELFLANFIYDFYGQRDLEGDNAQILVAGPVVSDKPKPGKLIIGSNRTYNIPNSNGGYTQKTILECTKQDLQYLIKSELGPFYKKSFDIIKSDWNSIQQLVNSNKDQFIQSVDIKSEDATFLVNYLVRSSEDLRIIPEHNYVELNSFFSDDLILADIDSQYAQLLANVNNALTEQAKADAIESLNKRKAKLNKRLIKTLFHEAVFQLQQSGNQIEIVDNLYGHFDRKTGRYESNPILMDQLVRLGQINPSILSGFAKGIQDNWTDEEEFWRQADYQVLVDLLQDNTRIDLQDRSGQWKRGKALRALSEALGGTSSSWIRKGRVVLAKINQEYEDVEVDREQEKEIRKSFKFDDAYEYLEQKYREEIANELIQNPKIRGEQRKDTYIEQRLAEKLQSLGITKEKTSSSRAAVLSEYIKYKKQSRRTISITQLQDFKKWNTYQLITNPYLYTKETYTLFKDEPITERWWLSLGVNQITVPNSLLYKYPELKALKAIKHTNTDTTLVTVDGKIPVDLDSLNIDHAKFSIDYLLDIVNTFSQTVAKTNIANKIRRTNIDILTNEKYNSLLELSKPPIKKYTEELKADYIQYYETHAKNPEEAEQAWQKYFDKNNLLDRSNLLMAYAKHLAHKKWDNVPVEKIIAENAKEFSDVVGRTTTIELNPEISKLNLTHYFYSQEYLNSTVGSHINHPFKRGKKIHEIEAEMFGQQTKRNVSYTATKYGFVGNTLRGLGNDLNIAILEEIDQNVFNFFGDSQSVSVYNGATFVYGAMAHLENESLGNQAVGSVKKEFVHDYKKTGTGVIVKTAGFPITNQNIRNSKFYARLNEIMGSAIGWQPANGNYQDWISVDTANGKTYVFDWTKTWNGNRISILANDDNLIYYKGNDGKHYAIIPSSIHVDTDGHTKFTRIEVAAVSSDNAIAGERVPMAQFEPVDFGIIDNNYKLWQLFGGAWSEHISTDKVGNRILTYEQDEQSFFNLVECMSQSCRLKEHLRESGNPFRPRDSVFQPNDMSDVNQPLKEAMIAYIPTEEAVKQGASNINTEAMLTDPNYHVTTMKLSNWDNGVQLDAEHEVDGSLLTLMTQVVNALGARGYSAIDAQEVYEALYQLTVSNLGDLFTGLQQYINNPQDSQRFKEAIAQVIIKSLQETQATDGNLIAAISTKIKGWNGTDGYEFIKNLIPISHPEVFKKIISNIANALKKKAIRIKFPGSMSVLNPSDGFIKIFNGRLLSEYGNELSEDGIPTSLKQAQRNQQPITDQRGNIATYKLRLGTIYKCTLQDNLENIVAASLIGGKQNINFLSELNKVKQFFRNDVNLIDPPTYWQLREYVNKGYVKSIVENIEVGRDLANIQYEIVTTEGQHYSVWDLDVVKDKWHWYSRKSFDKLPITEKEQQMLSKYGYVDALDLKQINNFMQQQLQKALNAIGSGNEGSVYIDGRKQFIDKSKTKTFYYEAIGGKIMKTAFGLEEGDTVGDIVNDKNFFIKRILRNRANRVPASQFDIALKTPSGKHTYIQFDDGSSQMNTEGLYKVELEYRQDAEGNWYRIDHNHNNMYQIPMKLENGQWVPDCEIYTNGSQEIIRTGNLLHFLDKTDYWNITLSSHLLQLDTNAFIQQLRQCDKNAAKRLLTKLCRDKATQEQIDSEIEILEKQMDDLANTIKEYKSQELLNPDTDFSSEIENLTKQIVDLEAQIKAKNILSEDEINNPKNISVIQNLEANETKAIEQFIKTGKQNGLDRSCIRNAIETGTKMYVSFLSSLKVIASRTPAQSHQSFMAMMFVGFDNADKNNAFVSRWQLWLQGSDYDIDKGNLLTRNYSNGLLVTWSNLMSLESEELLKASETLPFPTGKDITTTDDVNQQQEVFEKYERPLEVSAYLDDETKEFVTNYQLNDNPNVLLQVRKDPKYKTKYDCILIKNNGVKLSNKDEFIIYNTLAKTLPKGAVIHAQGLDEEKLGLVGFQSTIDGTFKNNKIIDKESQLIWFIHSFFDTTSDLELLETNVIFKVGLQDKKAQLIRNIATVIRTLNRMEYIPQTDDRLCQAVFKIVNKHNRYINNMHKGKERAIQNFISTYMFNISADPVNMIQGQSPIDAISDLIKSFAEDQPLAEKAKHFDTKAITSTFNQFVLTQAGKKNVGIVASAMKVLEAMSQFYNTILNFGGESEQSRLMVARQIMGKTYNFIANTYAKNFSNVIEDLRESLLQVDNINDAFIWMSGLLTLATDNAKDPTLAKINAGPEMISLYTSGLAMGIPFEDLVTLIASNTGRILSDLQKGNVFNDEQPIHNIDSAIRYIQRGPTDTDQKIIDAIELILKAQGIQVEKLDSFNLKTYLAGNGFPDQIAAGKNILRILKRALYSEDAEEELQEVLIKTAVENTEDLIKLSEQDYYYKNYQRYLDQLNPQIKECEEARIQLNKTLSELKSSKNSDNAVAKELIKGELKRQEKTLKQLRAKKEKIVQRRQNIQARIEDLNKLKQLYETKASPNTESLIALDKEVTAMHDAAVALATSKDLNVARLRERNHNFRDRIDKAITKRAKNYGKEILSQIKEQQINPKVLERFLDQWDQYLDYLSQVNRDTYFNPTTGKKTEKIKDIAQLNQFNKEMGYIRNVLALNQDYPNSAEDAIAWVHDFEQIIISRAADSDKSIPENLKTALTNANMKIFGEECLKISLSDFVNNTECGYTGGYRKLVSDVYDSIKYKVNVLDVIWGVSHYRGYLTGMAILYNASKVVALNYRMVDELSERVVMKQMKVSPKSKDMSKFNKMLSRFVTHKINQLWFQQQQQVVDIKDDNGLSVKISLTTNHGRQAFRRWMEQYVFPEMKRQFTRSNEFVKHLTKSPYAYNANHGTTINYTTGINALPRSDRELAIFQEVKQGLNNLRVFTISKGGNITRSANGIPLTDLVFLYNLIAYDGQPGQSSFTALFEDFIVIGGNKMIDDYKKFIGSLDLGSTLYKDVDYTDDEVQRYIAVEMRQAALRTSKSDKIPGSYAWVQDASTLQWHLLVKTSPESNNSDQEDIPEGITDFEQEGNEMQDQYYFEQMLGMDMMEDQEEEQVRITPLSTDLKNNKKWTYASNFQQLSQEVTDTDLSSRVVLNDPNISVLVNPENINQCKVIINGKTLSLQDLADKAKDNGKDANPQDFIVYRKVLLDDATSFITVIDRTLTEQRIKEAMLKCN